MLTRPTCFFARKTERRNEKHQCIQISTGARLFFLGGSSRVPGSAPNAVPDSRDAYELKADLTGWITHEVLISDFFYFLPMGNAICTFSCFRTSCPIPG